MSAENETGLAEIDENGLAEMPEDVGGFKRMPKVSFYGTSAKEPRLSKLKEAGVKVGSFYLEDDAGIVAPDPFYFFATPCLFHFYGKLDVNGAKVLGLRPKERGGWRPDRSKAEDKGWEDTTQALVLVPLGDAGLTPALLRTHKAVDRIWDPVAQTSSMAKDPAVWAVRGPAYKEAAEALHACGRFVLNCWVVDEKPASGKGNPFAKGYSKVIPTPKSLVPVFNDYITSPAYKEAAAVFAKIRASLVKLPSTV